MHFTSDRVSFPDLFLSEMSSREYLCLQQFMYSCEETFDIRQNLLVGMKLKKTDPRVGRDLSSPYRLRAGDLVAFGSFKNGFKVAEVIKPYVEFTRAENFIIIVKANKRSEKRRVQYGADLIRKLLLHPATATLPAGPCNRATGGRGKR
jgi:hypothetical protein